MKIIKILSCGSLIITIIKIKNIDKYFSGSEEDEDCGKMVINAVTKTKKILKYIRKQRKTNIHLIKKK